MASIIRGVSSYRLDPDKMNDEELAKTYSECLFYLKISGKVA